MSFTVTVPSRTISNLRECVSGVRSYRETCRIIVIDDGLESRSVEGCEYIQGIKEFCFARNCNLGIKASDPDSVLLLNDDAVLQTRGGFSLLQQSAEEHPEYGIISATTNVTGNPEQQPRGVGLREAQHSIAFIAVLIPRRTIEQVGLMDERFGGIDPSGKPIYGWCDNDYVRRVRNAGLKVGIHDGCFVDHGSLRSSFRGDPRAAGDISYASKLYREKWGDLR